MSRMRRLLQFAWVSGCVGSLAFPLLAQEADELGRHNRGVELSESPQDLAVELRFGRYVPNVDSGLSGTPFLDTFGNDSRYYGGFEIDWQLLRIPYFGTLAPAFGFGYTLASANAPLADGSGPSDQKTSLEIFPMYLVGVVRADVVAKKSFVPLVPYAKFGFGYALWNTSDEDDLARVDGVEGRGSSYGYQFALGGMLLLDVFDLQDARTADANIGLNHSYLFAEWYVSKLDGFGSSDTLDVGDNTWMLGLALEF
jgi:hypothetical protein